MSTNGINVSAIERDLANVWRDEAIAGDEEGAAVTRARVLTLLVYSDNESAGQELADTIAAVTEQHPCRALVMTVDPQAPASSATASVAASCRVQGPRSKQLSCETVNFGASGEGVKELPSAVAQLLAPDVPVFLWWRSSKEVDDYNLLHLIPMTDRVIIDSSRAASPRAELNKLAGILRGNPAWTGITDFTWQRLTPWREMIASFFDGPDHRPYLDRVDRVTVQYTPGERSSDISARAMLLVSWLAERLGWRLDAAASSRDGDENHFVFRAGDRGVAVRFIPVQRHGLEGLISSVRLDVTGEPSATFSVTRAERNRLASEAAVGGRPTVSRVTAYRSRTEAELLAGELGILGRDRLYEAAVAIAGEMGAVKDE
jgi:glucose-6-phosphate dehydrogenase assembly protein OpcA